MLHRLPRRSSRLPLGLLAVVLLTIGGATACTGGSKPAAVYLFLVDAPSGRVDQGANGLELVIPVDEGVTWFTDRPVRRTGNETLQTFAENWDKDGYTADPPEAALEIDLGDADEIFVVELGVPTIVGGWVHFPISDVQAEEGRSATHAGRDATANAYAVDPESIALFIEAAHTCSMCKVTK